MTDKPHISLSKLRDFWGMARRSHETYDPDVSDRFRVIVDREVMRQTITEQQSELAQLRAQLAAIKRNGHIPQRDTVGGVINSEWDMPEEDAAWAHLEGQEAQTDEI